MKLMRGYRFRREAFKMLKAFLAVFFAAFVIEAVSDWVQGRAPAVPLVALALSALISMLITAGLLVIDIYIRRHEKKHGAQYPAPPV
jgi:putative effector of murein hydrolase LrgA (UPF0299 family)